jgi:hypothetical protein
VMLTAYFDDTGTHRDAPIIGFGGLIGNEEQWYLFDASWRAKLKSPLSGKLPLHRFHMTECMARTGEFGGYSEPERDAVIHDFRQLIIASGVWGYAVGVSRCDWEELIAPSTLRAWLGDAEAFCFRDCVAKMGTFVRELSRIDKELALVFDDRPQRTAINRAISKQYQGIPEPLGAKLVGVRFLDSISAVPLQGADLFAWEFYAHVRAMLSTGGNDILPRPHAKQFFDCGRFHMGFVDRATCEKLLSVELRSAC